MGVNGKMKRDSFSIGEYLTEGWLFKESNEGHILFNRVEELVKELADSNGIVDLRPANLDLTWTDEEDDDAEEIGAYLLSLGKDGKVYVSTGPEDNPKSGDTVTLERYCSLLQEHGAIAHDVDVMLDAIVEALEILTDEIMNGKESDDKVLTVIIFDWTGDQSDDEVLYSDNKDDRWEVRSSEEMSREEITDFLEKYSDEEVDDDYDYRTDTTSIWFRTNGKFWRVDIEGDFSEDSLDFLYERREAENFNNEKYPKAELSKEERLNQIKDYINSRSFLSDRAKEEFIDRYTRLINNTATYVSLDAVKDDIELCLADELNEAENFNNEKYPKAEAWLEEHPDIKYFNEVPEQFLQYDIDKEDDPDSENIETAVTEAGYMFISELEAALEGGMDDEYLESCAMNGVINDPTYNPPIDSWDYRIK